MNTVIGRDGEDCAASEETIATDPEIASTSAQPMPKKGILKQSSSHATIFGEDGATQPKKQQTRQFRPSPDRFADRQATKIPKLTLTWSEKNAVSVYGDTTSDDTTENDDAALNVPAITPFSTQKLSSTSEQYLGPERQTAILNDGESEETDTHDESQANSDCEEPSEGDGDHSTNEFYGNSHISGKWWFGKSTKNIPHCAKWGCTHGDSQCTDSGAGTTGGDEYLTPTQRRSKELHHLKKQLKFAFSQLETKDTHLNELRERLCGLESMIGSTNVLNEHHKIILRNKEIMENFDREKQKLIDNHEIRVRQLIQEAVNARADVVELRATVKRLEKCQQSMRNAETMTEDLDDGTPPEVPTAPTDNTRANFPFASSTDAGFGWSPLTEQQGSTLDQQQAQMMHNLMLQLQVYENEAMVWRTKAAQLEIVLKEKLLESQSQNYSSAAEKYFNECERLRAHIKTLEKRGVNRVMTDSGIETNTANTISPDRHPQLNECYSPQCIDRRTQLISEKNELSEKLEDLTLRLDRYEEDVRLLRQKIHLMEDENRKNFLAMEQMSKEIEEGTAKVQAANLSVVRLQTDIATKTKAICYLEERHQVYRNVILDNNLVITDESTEDWRRGFSDPRYVVNLSKRVQTDLTTETIWRNEERFLNLKDKLKILENEFASKQCNMLEEFKEIEETLLAKSALVDLLTRQLEDADREAARTTELHQQERDQYQERLCELGEMAQNVPVLQYEIEKLQQERGLLEFRLKSAKEEYDTGLEGALAESLKKYQQQSTYWSEKVSLINASNEKLKNEFFALKQSMEELKLRSSVEKAQMGKNLTSSIDHIASLRKQTIPKTRDVEVDAHPRVMSKYVACRPNTRDKTTGIGMSDLNDEVGERLKFCQGELNTTRRQVEVLQQKLMNSAQQQESLISLLPSAVCKQGRSAMIEFDNEEQMELRSPANNSNSSILKQRLDDLERHNSDLRNKLQEAEEERQKLIKIQRDQIKHLVAEFDILRKDLDRELNRYENEGQRLRAKIAVLEKVKVERDQLYDRLKNISNTSGAQTSEIEETQALSSPSIPESTTDDRGSSSKEPQQLTNEMIMKRRIKKWLSMPYLFRRQQSLGFESRNSLRERNNVLASQNARLNVQFIALKKALENSMHRATRLTDVASITLPIYSDKSSVCDLAADLSQVREDLQNVIVQIDRSINCDQLLMQKSAQTLSSPSSSKASFEPINATPPEKDNESLRRALKQSEEEREKLSEKLDRLTYNFQDVCRELDLYKHEPRDEALKLSKNIRLSRSRSYIEIGRLTVDLEEHIRWKEKAGTMFRELNRLRNEQHQCELERRDLRLQLMMTRGELCMAQAENAELLADSLSNQTLSSSPIRTRTSNQPARSEQIKSKSVQVQSVEWSEDCRSRHCSSSGTYQTALDDPLLWSINDLPISINTDPEWDETRNRRRSSDCHRRKCRSASRGPTKRRCSAGSLDARSGHSSQQRGMQSNNTLHDEIVKEANEQQITTLRHEINGLQDGLTLRNSIEALRKMTNEQSSQSESAMYPYDQPGNERSTTLELRSSSWEMRSVNESQAIKLQQLIAENERLQKEFDRLVEEDKVRKSGYEARISMLSRENELFVKKIEEMDKERQEMYLVMFKKGKQAAEHEVRELKEIDEMTEDRIVLRFLHDAFYYYLMNKGDSREHLQAIMTMLNFSREQKEDIRHKRGSSH